MSATYPPTNNSELARLQKIELRYISQFLEMLAAEFLMTSEEYEVLNRAAEMIRETKTNNKENNEN